MRRTLLPLLVLCALVHPLFAAVPLFRNPRGILIGPGGATNDLVTGDFNVDGNADFLIVQPGGQTPTVTVHPGQGNGLFGAPMRTPVDSFYGAIGVGDVNEDRVPDLALAGWTTGLQVRLGNGDGTFRAGGAIAFPLVGQAKGAAVGDVTGDGHADIVTVVEQSIEDDRLAIFPGNGSGAFGAPIVLTTDRLDATAIAIMDVNADGRPDVCAMGRFRYDGAVYFPANGTGGFGAGVYLPGVPVGDLNGDGHADLVHADTYHRRLAVHLWTPTGYGLVWYPIQPERLDALAASDLNGDGRIDLIAGCSGGARTSVLINRGDGTFHPAITYAGIADSFALATADFNEDGPPEIVSIDYNDGRITIAYGAGASLHDAHRSYAVRSEDSWVDAKPRGAVVEDTNGDGRRDVITVSDGLDNDVPVAYITVLPGAGGGVLGLPIQTRTAVENSLSGAAPLFNDYDGDGRTDVVLVDTRKIYTYLANGDGTFRLARQLAVATDYPFSVMTGDFNGDGKADLLSSSFFAGDGTGGFATPVPRTLYVSGQRVAADVNGDGRTDLVSDARASLANADGTFAPALPIVDWYDESARAVADLNADGKADVVSQNYGNSVKVRLGNGDGTFGPAIVMRTPWLELSERVEVRCADIDGDGRIDVAFGPQVLLGDGAGGFLGYGAARVLDTHTSAALGDLDGNGSPDVVAVGYWDETVDVFLTHRGASDDQPMNVTVALQPGPSTYGAVRTVAASETHASSFAPWGAALFRDNGKIFAIAPFDVETYTLPLATGAHTLSATFSGDDVFAQSSSALPPFDVTRTPTSLTLFSSYSPSVFGEKVWIEAWLASAPPPLVMPTGTVILRDNGQPLQTFSAAATMVYETSALALGTHTLTAEYGGDANYLPATATYTHVVNKPAPAMTLATDPGVSSIAEGTEVIFTAKFPQTPGITGKVYLLRGNVVLAQASITNATAVLALRPSLGYNSLYVLYDGDANWDVTFVSYTVTVVPRVKRDDFNGDGKADVAWRSSTVGETAFWMMNGTTKLAGNWGEISPMEWSTALRGDFDGDGKSDIFWRHPGGANALWLMNGATKTSGVYVESLSPEWKAEAVGDFDANGKADIFWRNTTTTATMVWLMSGSTRTKTVALESVPLFWTLSGASNFDGDLTDDLFWRNETTGENAIWLMTGGAKRSGLYTESAPPGWSPAGFGDFDADGRGDVFWRHPEGYNSIWLMRGAVKKAGVMAEFAPAVWRVAGVADYDGDGKSDIFWRATDGSNAMWLMDGTNKRAGSYLEWVPLVWQVLR